MEQLLEIINTVLKNRGKPVAAAITRESRLRDDLSMDSLDLAELTVRIEAVFDVDVFSDGIVTTVGEIAEKIESR